jgi:hypothetical protein
MLTHGIASTDGSSTATGAGVRDKLIKKTGRGKKAKYKKV